MPLLNADWALRQTQIADLNDWGTLWSTYGADKTAYEEVIADLEALDIPTFYDANAPPNGQHVSSPGFSSKPIDPMRAHKSAKAFSVFRFRA